MEHGTLHFEGSVPRELRPPPVVLHARLASGPLEKTLGHREGLAGVVLGRDGAADIQLNDATVSKRHARIWATGGGWVVMDLHSHNGVLLMGRRLTPGAATTIRPGDRLHLGAVTVDLVASAAKSSQTHDRRAELTTDGSTARGIAEAHLGPPAAAQIGLLAEAAVQMGAARTEREVAEIAGRSIADLTAATVAAVVSPSGALLSWVSADSTPRQTPARVSRAVVAAAVDAGAHGQGAPASAEHARVVTLAEMSGTERGSTVSQLGLTGALAAPIIVDDSVVAVVYADWRSPGMSDPAASASALLALSRVVALALSRVRQSGVAARFAEAQRDLETGRAAQRTLLPPYSGAVGGLSYGACFRPGTYIGGDFFDVLPLPDGRVACLLGDVCGHGVAAGLFMAVLVPHLRSLLLQGVPLIETVARCNRHMADVGVAADGGTSGDVKRFATLWLAAIEPATGKAEMIDCGHGYAFARQGAASPIQFSCDGGPPLGMVRDAEYRSSRLDLPRGALLVLVSDGAVEQPGGPEGRAFGEVAIKACVQHGGDPCAVVRQIESAVVSHGAVVGCAAHPGLQDDLTALAVALPG